MYLKGAINADSILNFSGGETRDMQSQQEGSAGDVLIVLSIEATEQALARHAGRRQGMHMQTHTYTHTQIRLHSIFSSFIISLFFPLRFVRVLKVGFTKLQLSAVCIFMYV